MLSNCHGSFKMEEVISNLKDDELLIIFCIDPNKRSILHTFLNENYPEIGHIGILLHHAPYEGSILMKCYQCSKLVPMTYHYGIMDNNEGEYYSGWCEECQHNLSWDWYYDDNDDDVIRMVRNNALCIGKTIQIGKPSTVNTINASGEKVTKIFHECTTHTIKTIPNWCLRGTQGKKGKSRLNRKTCRLIHHIQSCLPQQ